MYRLTLMGAYGRTYTTRAKALADWYEGKDFKICNGPYCSIRDIGHMTRLHDTVEIIIATGERVPITT